MREDGFEFDKWLMTNDRDFKRPEDAGPASVVHSGTAPTAFAFVKAMPKPANTTQKKPSHNAQAAKQNNQSYRLPAKSFTLNDTGFYLDKGKWAAVNPDQNKQGKVAKTLPLPTGNYNITLEAVGENDGRSTYQIHMDDSSVGDFTCPLSAERFEEGKKYHKTWSNVAITEGTEMVVTAKIGSNDGAEYSRARWAAVAFTPADDKTRKAAASFLTQKIAITDAPEKDVPRDSPTTPVSTKPLIQPRGADGTGSVAVSGELKTWHKVTLTLDGPFAHEQDNTPNPFTDHAMSVQFKHTDGTVYTVPGYFAADGNAGDSSAESGNKWRAHFAPDRVGIWNYQVNFRSGKHAALDAKAESKVVAPFNGVSGVLKVTATDKTGRDFRSVGRLQYVGKRYLQHAGSKQYFLKAGADAPETLLGYADFDNTIAGKAKVPLKKWTPHVKDWREGDPTWKNGKGKGLIGAINYLSGKGCNAFSFLTYNAGGDGDNVWPFIHRDDKMHYDCSKLDQWSTVFDHGTERGMYLHFKMQETENDDHKKGKGYGNVPTCLDGGNLGPQRKLYCRELIARFGHNLGLNWNLGEENTQTHDQQQDMINYIADLDAYGHNIVIHTYPNQQDKVYRPLLGSASKLTGLSLQNSGIKDTHHQTVKWVNESTKAGRPWVVAFDESGSAAHGQCPDIGYQGFNGKDNTGKKIYTPNEVRKQTLWGTLMGGGAGVEYYFGYQLAENDLLCEDWRSRDQSWDYCRIAINFFRENNVGIAEMKPADELVGNPSHNNDAYCLANPGNEYVVYVAGSKTISVDLSGPSHSYNVTVFNPRTGESKPGQAVQGGTTQELSLPDEKEDWVLLIRK